MDVGLSSGFAPDPFQADREVSSDAGWADGSLSNPGVRKGHPSMVSSIGSESFALTSCLIVLLPLPNVLVSIFFFSFQTSFLGSSSP